MMGWHEGVCDNCIKYQVYEKQSVCVTKRSSIFEKVKVSFSSDKIWECESWKTVQQFTPLFLIKQLTPPETAPPANISFAHVCRVYLHIIKERGRVCVTVRSAACL